MFDPGSHEFEHWGLWGNGSVGHDDWLDSNQQGNIDLVEDVDLVGGYLMDGG